MFEGDQFVLLPCKFHSLDQNNATVVWSRSELSPSTCVVLTTGLDSGYKVKVEEDSGVEFVLLPCRTTVHLPKDAKVEWTDSCSNKVHVYQNRCNKPEKQSRFYRNRTKMNEDLLDSGDLSLTLKHPTRYMIIIAPINGIALDFSLLHPLPWTGADAVLLPCETTVQLLQSSTVQWKDSDNCMVHMFQGGSDHFEHQDKFYRNRTEMNKDLLQTGDLSLTLKHLTYGDSNIYTCSISSREGDLLMKKQVQLHVRGWWFKSDVFPAR
ncbi:hypothetical protein XENOCAPTIV_030619 [Xenoophorus captivus]|uniref:Ig-like domain-containing protein n=1 Tax=Xenoophorus captivus TaxID=1517983 RepID=A0ABV0QXE5_9TELE